MQTSVPSSRAHLASLPLPLSGVLKRLLSQTRSWFPQHLTPVGALASPCACMTSFSGASFIPRQFNPGEQLSHSPHGTSELHIRSPPSRATETQAQGQRPKWASVAGSALSTFSASQLCLLVGRAPHRTGVWQASCERDRPGRSDEGRIFLLFRRLCADVRPGIR